LRYRQLAVGIVMTLATGYISPVLGQLQAQSINTSNLSSALELNSIRPTTLLTPNNQTAQAIPINPNLSLPRPINPSSTIFSAPTTIERLSFSNTGQLTIEANQPVSYRTNFDLASGIYNLTIANAKISPNL
jgi:hypothetical protein